MAHEMHYQRLNLTSLLMVFSIVVPSPVLAAATQTDLQRGIASYTADNHTAALSYLQAHLAKNQKDGVAHYYLANSLLKLGRTADAMLEYRKAYELSPANGKVREYCLLALQEGAVTVKQEPVAKPPSADEVEVAKTLATIKRQSEIVKLNKTRAEEANSGVFSGRGKYDEARMRSDCEARVRLLQQPDMYDIHGRAIFLDHSEEIAKLRRDTEEAIARNKITAQQEEIARKAASERDASKMQGDEENLRNQLTESRHLPGTPTLQATGTNFYTRQYGNPRAEKKEEPIQDELLATPDKMVLDPHSKPGANKYRIVKEPLVADQDKLHNNAPGTDLRVKGTLIRK
jgi:tetratricopeptide (TPR) repeat protein